MGLFSRKIKNPAKGTAQIIAASRHGGEGRWQNCRMQLVVHVEGNEPYSAEVHQIAPRKKWPQPGMTVPVDVDRKDRSRVKVDFDAMEDSREMARRLAEQHAAQAASGAAASGGAPGVAGITGMPGAGGPGGGQQVNIIGDPSQLPPERLAQVEQMLGMDLDGDGTVGGISSGASAGPGAGVRSGGAGADGGDRIAKLERLAALHASGALSDEEFEIEKQRLLGH